MQEEKQKNKYEETRDSSEQPTSQISSRHVFQKATIFLIRSSIFIVDIITNNADRNSTTLCLSIGSGIFIFCELFCWYRYSKSNLRSVFNIPLTVLAHSFILLNILGPIMTVNISEVTPYEFYFTIFVPLIFAHMLAITNVYSFFQATVIMNGKHFFATFEPIQESLVYIYVALFIGSFMDFLTFSGQSTYVFYVVVSSFVVYWLVKGIKSGNFIELKKLLTSQ